MAVENITMPQLGESVTEVQLVNGSLMLAIA